MSQAEAHLKQVTDEKDSLSEEVRVSLSEKLVCKYIVTYVRTYKVLHCTLSVSRDAYFCGILLLIVCIRNLVVT